MKADAEAGGPSSQGSLPPTSAGRVSGFGTSMKFINYYHSDAQTKKDRRKPSKDKAEVLELRKKGRHWRIKKWTLPRLSG